MSAEQLRHVSTRRFLVLLSGLPAEAAFPRVWARTPRTITDPREIAALTSAPASANVLSSQL